MFLRNNESIKAHYWPRDAPERSDSWKKVPKESKLEIASPMLHSVKIMINFCGPWNFLNLIMHMTTNRDPKRDRKATTMRVVTRTSNCRWLSTISIGGATGRFAGESVIVYDTALTLPRARVH